jgi:drug/metabolite transporter superfamily protein YnfA
MFKMKQRTRKLIGTFATVVYLSLYALVGMAIGGVFVVGNGGLIELAYFILAGLAWIPGSMLIIRWMSKPDSTDIHAAQPVE